MSDNVEKFERQVSELLVREYLGGILEAPGEFEMTLKFGYYWLEDTTIEDAHRKAKQMAENGFEKSVDMVMCPYDFEKGCAIYYIIDDSVIGYTPNIIARINITGVVGHPQHAGSLHRKGDRSTTCPLPLWSGAFLT